MRLATLLVPFLTASCFCQDYNYTGSNFGLWHDSSNWSPTGVPGSGDRATIASKQVQVDGPVSVDSLTMTSASLSMMSTLEIQISADLTDAVISGSATLTVNPTAILNSNAGFSAGSSLECPVSNLGTLNSVSGVLTLTNANNSGTLTSEAGAKIVVPSGATLISSGTIGGTVDLVGYLNLYSASLCTGTLNISGTVSNGYLMVMMDGTVNVSGVAFIGAYMIVNSGGTLNLLPFSNAYAWTYLECSGAINVTDANAQFFSVNILGTGRLTSNVNLSSENTITSYFNNYGLINAASGTLNLHDTYVGMSNLNGGALTSAPGAKIVIASGSTLYNYGTISGTLDLQGNLQQNADSQFTGTLNISGSTNGAGGILLDGTANVSGTAWLGAPMTIGNGAFLNFLPNSNVNLRAYVTCSGEINLTDAVVQGTFPYNTTLLSTGTLTSSGNGNAFKTNIDNFGLINAASGTLQLGDSNSATQIMNESSGTLTSAPAAKNIIPTGILFFNGGTIAGTMDMAGSLFQITDSHFTGTLNASGSIWGSGSLLLDGTMNMSGFFPSLSTGVSVSSSGILNFLPQSYAYITSNVDCSGAINITDAVIEGSSNISILPTGVLTSTVVLNDTNSIYAEIHNLGVINAASGRLELNNSWSSGHTWNEYGGTLTSAPGARLVIPTTLYNSGTISGTMDILGNLQQNNDSHCIGTLNISGWTSGAGTLLLDGTANVTAMAFLSANMAISNGGTLNFLPFSNAAVGAMVNCNGTINLTNTNVYSAWPPGTFIIQSTGTLNSNMTTGIGNAFLVNIYNSGSINAASGTLRLGDNFSDTWNNNDGVLTSSTGASIVVGSGSTLYNSGSVLGTMTVYGDLEQVADTHYPDTLNISGSTGGYGNLFIDGTTNLSGYPWLAAHMVVNNTGTLNFLPASNAYLAANVDCSGTTNVTAANVGGTWPNGIHNLATGTVSVNGSSFNASLLNYGTVHEIGNVSFTGGYLQQAGTTSIEGASVNILTMNAGLLTGAGSIQRATIDGGVVQPLGLLTVGNYQQSGGTLQFDIAGSALFGRLQIDNFTNLTSALNVSFTNGFAPVPGDRFEIVTANNVYSEQLSPINLPAGEQVVDGPSNIIAGYSSLTVMGLPVLQSISPSSGAAFNNSTVTMTATGAQFAPNSTILLAGTALPTTWISPTQLQATFNCSGLSVGSYDVTVVGPSPQHIASNTLQFVVQQAFAGPFWSNPLAITYGQALGAQQLNATASVPGGIVYSPPSGTVLDAGTHLLSATFTPTDAVNYQTSTVSVSITVNKAVPVITWANPAAIVYGTPLGATQLNATADVTGTFNYTPSSGALLASGSQLLSTTFTPTDITNYQTITASVSITINKATPTITWSNPAGIVYGTPLGAAQLNATANVPGSFSYTPPSGTVLTAGGHPLATTFTPSDAANYNGAAASVSITVDKATPAITWTNPANIVYGTPLSATQLNTSANVPGTFNYTPTTGTVLTAGAHLLTVAFTPTDTDNYQSTGSSATVTVDQAAPVITWSNPSNIVYGTPLDATQLNASANVPGSFSYTPTAGTILTAGAHLLSTTFTPTDTVNYQTITTAVSISIDKATPIITWSNPADIVDGTPLSSTQLNASCNVPGTFIYTPATGTLLGRGNGQVLSTAFTPSDTADYVNATATVTINVLNAPPVIASAATAVPNPVRYGATTTLSASATDLEQDILTYTWNFGDGTPAATGASLPHVYSTAGTYTAVVTITDGHGGSITSFVIVVVNPNAAPTVATAASATPNPVTGTSTALSVLGNDDTGEAGLTYTWSTTGTPPASVLFSNNGTNQAKNTQANFSKAGQYTLTATITDGNGATASSSVVVTVNQTFTTATVSPGTASVYINETQQFSAIAYDQFGNALASQPGFTWSVSGGGTISSAGLFTAANATGGPFTVTATSGTHSGTATLNVTVDAGLNAEFFDYTSSLSAVPDFTGKTADVARIDAQVNYAQTSSPWTGLDSRFASTFATRHHGYLKIDTAGTYTLYIKSSDGSNVYLDGAQIINNDGVHTLKEKSVQKALTAGYHALRIEYFDNTNNHGLIFSWQGPSISKNVVPASALFHGH